MKPKIIHTKTFYCDDDHPIVYYTFNKDNKAMCEYCSTHFVYEPKKTKTEEVMKILEENKITNVGKNTPYGKDEPKDFHTKMMEEKELLAMGLKDSIRQKEERTPSQEMQDKLEPIENYVNKILKGSG